VDAVQSMFIISIVQTRDDYVWLASPTGLFRA
jgi:hypothetical protein